jgi:hypothetical protein
MCGIMDARLGALVLWADWEFNPFYSQLAELLIRSHSIIMGDYGGTLGRQKVWVACESAAL